MELGHPEFRENFTSSNSFATTNSVEDAHGRMWATEADHMEGMIADPLSGSQEVAGQPVAIDAEENIWEVERLLGKWTQGGTAWNLVKWKGFEDKHITWKKPKDIDTEVVNEFEASHEGNHLDNSCAVSIYQVRDAH